MEAETVNGDIDFHPGRLRSIPEEDWRSGFANAPGDSIVEEQGYSRSNDNDSKPSRVQRLKNRLGKLNRGDKDKLNTRDDPADGSGTAQKTKAELAKEAAEAEKARKKEAEAARNAEVCNFMANALSSMIKKKTTKLGSNKKGNDSSRVG